MDFDPGLQASAFGIIILRILWVLKLWVLRNCALLNNAYYVVTYIWSWMAILCIWIFPFANILDLKTVCVSELRWCPPLMFISTGIPFKVPKWNTPDCYVVSWKIIVLNEWITRGGEWFIRSTTFLLVVMGRWKGSGLICSDGRGN